MGVPEKKQVENGMENYLTSGEKKLMFLINTCF